MTFMELAQKLKDLDEIKDMAEAIIKELKPLMKLGEVIKAYDLTLEMIKYITNELEKSANQYDELMLAFGYPALKKEIKQVFVIMMRIAKFILIKELQQDKNQRLYKDLPLVDTISKLEQQIYDLKKVNEAFAGSLIDVFTNVYQQDINSKDVKTITDFLRPRVVSLPSDLGKKRTQEQAKSQNQRYVEESINRSRKGTPTHKNKQQNKRQTKAQTKKNIQKQIQEADNHSVIDLTSQVDILEQSHMDMSQNDQQRRQEEETLLFNFSNSIKKKNQQKSRFMYTGAMSQNSSRPHSQINSRVHSRMASRVPSQLGTPAKLDNIPTTTRAPKLVESFIQAEPMTQNPVVKALFNPNSQGFNMPLPRKNARMTNAQTQKTRFGNVQRRYTQSRNMPSRSQTRNNNVNKFSFDSLTEAPMYESFSLRV